MMFITRFHKVIRNKLVWGILLGLIVLVFIDWASSTAQRSSLFDVVIGGIARVFNPEYGRNTKDAAGTFDEEPIPLQEYNDAFINAQAATSLMAGHNIAGMPRFRPVIERLAWKRLLTIKEARRLKLTVSEQEVSQAIQSNPAFQENGHFNVQQFQMFCTQYLPTIMPRIAHDSDPQKYLDLFRKVLAEELLINRMQKAMSAAAWAPPVETLQTFRQLHDSFLVSYVMITPDDLFDIPVVGLKEAKEYYEANSNDFRIPDQRRVRFISFAIEDDLDLGGVEEDAIENYYYSNLELFSKQDTNGVPVTTPLEYVEDDIREQLAMEEALDTATERARDFIDLLEPEGNEPPPDFMAVAQASGITVKTTAFFSARSAPLDVPGAGAEFCRAAFALLTPDEAEEGSVSYPVHAGDYVCVLSLLDEKKSHIPDFSEIEDKAMRLAEIEAQNKALLDFAESFRTRAESELEAGRTFDEIAADAYLPIITPNPFTVTTAMEVESEPFQAMLQRVIRHNAGELTALIPIRDGLMLAYIESRQPGDITTFEAIRFDMAKYIQQRKGEIIFSQWQESLMSAKRFANLLPLSHDELADDPDAIGDDQEADDYF